ncbi:MAG: hypothetical protein ACREYB_07255 [Casimicrobiaceae bacterium]
MNRALLNSMMFIVAASLAGVAGADGDRSPAGVPEAHATTGAQGPGAAAAPISGTELPSMGAKETRQLPPERVNGYRDEQVPCDRRHGTGKEACRAQLAAKYAEMDKLCRIVSGSELPVCIRSAYSAD